MARADWTPEGIEHQILTGQNLTRDRAHKLTGQRTRQRSDDPEKWNAKDWEAFDHEVVSAVQVITDALHLQASRLYEPSVRAQALLNLIRPQDLDAELAALTGQEG